MSNIDFASLRTPSTQAAGHKAAVKAECKRRIVAQFPQEAQQNIAQALALYALDEPAGLRAGDIAQVCAARAWITAMQAACRRLSQSPDADPAEDAAWPVLQADVIQLIKRF